MNIRFRFTKWSVLLIFFVTATFYSVRSKSEVPASWKSGSYAYAADKTPLVDILRDFSKSHGVVLDSVTLPPREVTAKIRAQTPEDFMRRISLEYRLQWFVYNNTLYVSELSQQISKRFLITEGTETDLKQALQNIGLLDSRFGWGEIPGGNAIIVTGPPKYISIISSFIKKPVEAEEVKLQSMSFPLKYAYTSDREIKYRDSAILVPGVTTLLKELLMLKGGSTGLSANSSDLKNPMIEATNSGSESIRDTLIARNISSFQNSSPPSINATVSADIRNNAVLIRDDAKRYLEYKELIVELDKAQRLIEIDAMIIDIDRNALATLSANWQAKYGGILSGSALASGASSLIISDLRSFALDIKTLENEGAASIIASPTILTLENHPALIDFSETAFLSLVGERVATVHPVTAGMSMRVVPRIIGNDGSSTIQMIIDVEDGKITRDAKDKLQGNHNGIISTQAMVPSNLALILGGFHQQQVEIKQKSIPLLGDIPYIGQLFKSTTQENSHRERLFIITPKLVGDQQDPERYKIAREQGQFSGAKGDSHKTSQIIQIKKQVESSLYEIVQNRVPADMHSGGDGLDLRAFCNLPVTFRINSQRQQWYSNKDLMLTIGVVTNNSATTQVFDENFCKSSRILGITVWPDTELKRGESAEVTIAYRPEYKDAQYRKSLLQE